MSGRSTTIAELTLAALSRPLARGSLAPIGGPSLVSLALMFAMRYSRHKSVLLSALIMANVPLALVGAVIRLWLSGQPLSVAAIVGFVTMAAIPVRTDAEKQEIELKPAGDKLEATGSFKVGPDTKAVAVVTVNGKAATAHFTLK